MIPPQVNGATSLVRSPLSVTPAFPMIPPQVNGATSYGDLIVEVEIGTAEQVSNDSAPS